MKTENGNTFRDEENEEFIWYFYDWSEYRNIHDKNLEKTEVIFYTEDCELVKMNV